MDEIIEGDAPDPEVVTQRVVPATGAQRPDGAFNSVFAMASAAGSPPAAEPPAAAAPIDLVDHARKAFESCGGLSCLQLMEVLECSRSEANRVIVKLRDLKVVAQLRKEGVVPIYGIPPKGFKAWLGRQAASGPKAAKQPRGAAQAVPAKKTKPQPRPARRTALVTHAPATGGVVELLPAAHAPSDLGLGFFMDGRLEIEADGVTLKLNPARARRLIDWVLRVDGFLATGGF